LLLRSRSLKRKTNRESEPAVLDKANFTIEYPKGHEYDAEQMLEWASQVISILLPVFPDALVMIGKTITIYLKEDTKCGFCSGGWTGNSPEMTFPLPSICAQKSASFDAEWYLGNIAHEFSHILYMKYRMTKANVGGYNYSDVPSWFGEGVGEYFRLLVMGEDKFEKKYSWYEPEVEKIIKYGLAGCSNVYAAGAWALRFFNDRYGSNTITRIMKSSQKYFGDALQEETGVSPRGFKEEFQKWLARVTNY